MKINFLTLIGLRGYVVDSHILRSLFTDPMHRTDADRALGYGHCSYRCTWTFWMHAIDRVQRCTCAAAFTRSSVMMLERPRAASMGLLLRLLLLYDVVFRVGCFNLETRLPIVKRGKADSYFGYSVAGHQSLDDVDAVDQSWWVADILLKLIVVARRAILICNIKNKLKKLKNYLFNMIDSPEQ